MSIVPWKMPVWEIGVFDPVNPIMFGGQESKSLAGLKKKKKKKKRNALQPMNWAYIKTLFLGE